jgi:hypothetical protein
VLGLTYTVGTWATKGKVLKYAVKSPTVREGEGFEPSEEPSIKVRLLFPELLRMLIDF